MRVLLTSQINKEALDILKEHADVDLQDQLTRQQLLEKIGEADVLFIKANIAADKELIDRGTKLKLIARHGAGYDNVDIPYATKKGIAVTATIGVNAQAVAEYTMGLMIALTRRFFEAAEANREGNIDGTKFMGMGLFEKTLGIIGFGLVGRELAKMAMAFNMNILAYDPAVTDVGNEGLKVQLVDLNTLLQKSDIISIHAALNEQTLNLISDKELSMMKKTAFLLNVARGRLVDEKALVEALKNYQIAAAGLDVVVDEPIQKGHPLLNLKNAIVMPHLASKVHEIQRKTAMWAVEGIIRVIHGEKPQRVVNPEVFDSVKH